MSNRDWWLRGASVAGVFLAGFSGWHWLGNAAPLHTPAAHAQAARDSAGEPLSSETIRIDAVHPKAGGLPRVTTQPGSVHAFDFADLYTKVSGYLAQQNVDIGDTVRAGQVLAVLDSPELLKEVERAAASVERAKAQVRQMQARVVSAQADHKAVEAAVVQAQADVQRDLARESFHGKQFKRISELFDLKSIDEKLVDEKEDQFRAAEAAVAASQASLATHRAQVVAAAAKIDQALADVADAEAEVRVAAANLGRAQVMFDYLKIVSPYDGVITFRGYHRGDFIKAADQGVSQPVVSVARVDLMRVIVPIPDRDVPYAEPGDGVFVEIDALPGRKFTGKLSRIAVIEDDKTRNMRAEVDLPNTERVLRGGMYGRVTIELQPAAPAAVQIPSSCLVGGVRDGQGAVFVVRDGKARKTPIQVGTDNGIAVEVLGGLTVKDLVVASNSGAIQDGTPVDATHAAGAEARSLGH
ncbi:MAG: efflux RND transporter periplasmic adaptor subunit [Planctomycetes bacterium]|nr:efflux RND transporter periplasmic adaptor subunit [Planctomycetota bacterium]